MPSSGNEENGSAASGRRLVVGAAVLWSLSGVVAKGLSSLDGVTIAFYRSLFAGLALLPFIPIARWTFRPSMAPVVLVFGAMVGFYLCAMARTTAANAILLQCTAMVWVLPLSIVVLREWPDRRAMIAIAVATVGIIAIVVYGRKGTPGEGLGIAFGLASGLGYAIVVIAMRAFRDLDPAWLSATNNLGGALALGAFTWVATGSVAVPSFNQGMILIAFGVIQMAIPYALFAKGLRTIGVAEAGLISLLEPVLNPIWVVLAHGEIPAPATIYGGAILLGGVAIRYMPTRWISARD